MKCGLEDGPLSLSFSFGFIQTCEISLVNSYSLGWTVFWGLIVLNLKVLSFVRFKCIYIINGLVVDT